VDATWMLVPLVLSIVAVVIDLKTARISNWLTGIGFAVALLFRARAFGWAGVQAGLFGALCGAGLLFLPFRARGIGGGDVKLMAALGAWLSTAHALTFILATAIAGGLWAIAYLAMHQQTGQALSRVAQTLCYHLVPGVPRTPDSSANPIHFPYSLAIASGVFFVFISSSLSVWR
jgi:prepilin peptidase CpaA